RSAPPQPPTQHRPAGHPAALATWPLLLDAGRLQDGEPHLAGTAHPSVARCSAATAAVIGAADGDPVTLRTARGRLTLPVQITEMIDDVVWVPTNSPLAPLYSTLAAGAGDVVAVTAEGPA
ncbi:MAG: molybdopterin dinucleotide binding domain-containing protein, partial [Gordonia sp. (in: high G+C Gram-positive bacteria)]